MTPEAGPGAGGRRTGRARERILSAAVRRIAREGIDGVRIARIATDAGVSPALVHYHFDSRDRLLAEALEYSYLHTAEVRLDAEPPENATHAQRLEAMIESCLPSSPSLHEDWVLWVELWLRCARQPELRPFAEELYARMTAWFAEEIAAGVAEGEFQRCDPHEVAERALALLDGYGVRALIGDRAIPLRRARREVVATLAGALGLGDRLSPAAPPQTTEPAPSASRAAPRPVRTAPSM